jgi:hypothetical protein
MFQTADAAGRHPQQRQRSIDYPDLMTEEDRARPIHK